MKKVFFLAVIIVFFFSCKKKELVSEVITADKDTVAVNKEIGKEFKMYTMSPMASLMEQMYVHNQVTKNKILKGEAIGTFPEYFLNIHTAEFTDETDNDIFFKTNAKLFIEAQRLLYAETENVNKNYNLAIDACITCHEKKCGGPIPRIKKLYLK